MTDRAMRIAMMVIAAATTITAVVALVAPSTAYEL
jgi:hypothetical protein